jgi:2-hydroxy-4-carboxymuconate semialdehyde hemiacetal dehydrogenase
MFNVCMIGHGMMGRWHSETLASVADCRLHTLVGRRPEPTAAFAREFGYQRWSTDLAAALADPAIDLVIVANPSEAHAATTIAALESGRHTLCEIPLGMDLREATAAVEAADAKRRKLGLVFPMRAMPDMLALQDRVRSGHERIRLIECRFIIKRWENVGYTGYRRSWTDNLLWHHLGHLVDFAFWLAGSAATNVWGHLPAADPKTGTPMDAFVGVATDADQSFVFLGSYAGHQPVCDTLVLSDRDCYRLNMIDSTLAASAGVKQLVTEQVDCAAALHSFLDAVRADREPAISGRSALPAMAALQAAQDGWDARYGVGAIPGRGLPPR